MPKRYRDASTLRCRGPSAAGVHTGQVLQILTERPQHIRADVGPPDDLAVRPHGNDKVREYRSCRRWRMSASASPSISPRMARRRSWLVSTLLLRPCIASGIDREPIAPRPLASVDPVCQLSGPQSLASFLGAATRPLTSMPDLPSVAQDVRLDMGAVRVPASPLPVWRGRRLSRSSAAANAS